MKTNFSLLFYLKKPKNYQNGPAPIYIRITIKGRRSEITTGRSCIPSHWNTHAGRTSGSKEDFRSLNAYLDLLQRKIYDAHAELTAAGETFTSESLRNRFQGKDTKPLTLIQVFKDHNEKLETLVGSEYSKGTAQRYRTSLKHTLDFLKSKYKAQDIELKKINYTFIYEYDYYLRSVRKCANNSAVKYIKNLGKIIRICLASGWMETDPFLNYKPKVKKVNRVYLNQRELDLIAGKKMDTVQLTYAKDIFLFCCYTGLAYIDVKDLRPQHIITGIDGQRWISINRQKTNIPSRIPLLPIAASLLNQYQNNPVCLNKGKLFPVTSNQQINSHLKEIAKLCNIHKPITFHIARHTFATTVTLLNGIPIETVSKMLGHTNIRTTQHYAKILDIKISADMALLREIYT